MSIGTTQGRASFILVQAVINATEQEADLLEVIKRKPTSTAHALPSSQELAPVPSSPLVLLRRNDFNSSTKLDRLMSDLRKLRDQDPCFRAVVFSQYVILFNHHTELVNA